MRPDQVLQIQEALRRCLVPAFYGNDMRVSLHVHPGDREELGEAVLPMAEGDSFKVHDNVGVDRGFVLIRGPGAPMLRLPSAPAEVSDGQTT